MQRGRAQGVRRVPPDKKQRVSVLLGGEPFSGNCCYAPEADTLPVHPVKPLGVQERQWKREAAMALDL